MKKLILGFVLLGMAWAQDPQPPASIPLPDGTNTWKLIFQDEFDSTTWDRSKWTPHADWGGTKSFNSGREHYYESQIQVSDGICNLVAEPHPTITDFDGSYMSGEILTCRDHSSEPYKFTYKYGYIEARVKIVNIPGFFGAFWLLPAKTNYTYEWEIDILEVLGHDYYTMHQTYHYRPGLPYDQSRNTSWKILDNPGRNGTGPDMNFSRDYHTFGCDWQADRLAFYIDGIQSGDFPDKGVNNSNIPRTAGYIIIQHMVDNTWIRSQVPLPNTTISETFYIDYVRVWQAEYDPDVSLEDEMNKRAQTVTAVWDGRLSKIPNPATKYDIKRAGADLSVVTLGGDMVDVDNLTAGRYLVGSPEAGVLRQFMVIEK